MRLRSIQPALRAFFAAALVITITLQLIERVKSFDLLALLKKGD